MNEPLCVNHRDLFHRHLSYGGASFHSFDKDLEFPNRTLSQYDQNSMLVVVTDPDMISVLDFSALNVLISWPGGDREC